MHTVHVKEHHDAPNAAEQEVTVEIANEKSPAVNDESKGDEGGDGMNLFDFHQTTLTWRGAMY